MAQRMIEAVGAELDGLANEVMSKPESLRETLYCNIVDFYELNRGEQWDLQLMLAEQGWER